MERSKLELSLRGVDGHAGEREERERRKEVSLESKEGKSEVATSF